MKYFCIFLITYLLFFSCQKNNLSNNYNYFFEKNQFVIIKTSLGDIELELFATINPLTVGNFIDLAEGKKIFLDVKTGKETKRHYYDNTIFHRIIKDFMIQGGDQEGSGQGGPGYTFNDEITLNNKNKRGTIAMANRGPNTNGSQFFINLVNNSYLNSKHTVFGQVIKGMEVVDSIAETKTNHKNFPEKSIIIKSIRLKK